MLTRNKGGHYRVDCQTIWELDYTKPTVLPLYPWFFYTQGFNQLQIVQYPVFTTEKYPHVSDPKQFNSVLFKSQPCKENNTKWKLCLYKEQRTYEMVNMWYKYTRL